MKETTVHVKNIVYMLYNSSVIMNKVRDFALAFWVQIDFLASWTKAPGLFLQGHLDKCLGIVNTKGWARQETTGYRLLEFSYP